MSVVDEYLASLQEPEKSVVTHLYGLVRQWVPEVTQELSYGIPTFKYKGKSLVAIMATKNGLSLYPFCGVNRLGVNLAGFETTSGSVHFTASQPLPDETLHEIITARRRIIDA